MPKRNPNPKPSPYPRPSQSAAAHVFEPVPALWLLRALLIIVGGALLALYLAYAALFYFGQWQLVLHPSHTVAATPADDHLPFESVRFGVDATGLPQRTAWWVPASPLAVVSTTPASGSAALTARYANFTLLYLHGATGSLADTLPALNALHSLGINIFAIDYRGYGQSADIHPTQSRMSADAADAFDYLVSTRHLRPAQIIPCGEGVGATLAAQLAAAQPAVPAVLLLHPPDDLLASARRDSRSRLLPVALLFHERFDIVPTLASLTTPKFILFTGAVPDWHIAGPTTAVTLPANLTTAAAAARQSAALARFFDDSLPQPPAVLTPSP